MDKILLGIAASMHPQHVKKAVFLKIISSASTPLGVAEVTSILRLSSQWIVNEEGFLHDMGHQIFEAWAKYNQAAYEDYFCHDFLISTLGESITNPLQVIGFIRNCLQTLSRKRQAATKIIQMRVIGLCRGFPDIVVQGEICRLLLLYQDCIPKDAFATTYCQALISNTAALKIPDSEEGIKLCMDGVVLVSNMLKVVWLYQRMTIIPSLTHIFNIISTVSDENLGNGEESSLHSPCLAIGALVQHIPLEVIEAVTKSAVNDACISDARMTVALQRMIDWLSWPGVINIDNWIITFLRSLAAVRKFTILINVTVYSVDTMLLRLCFPVIRESAFRVLSHMMLSFQHSPEAFHKIIDQIPETMQKLRQENSPSSQICMFKFAELTYCLMYHHAGYPELYDTLLDTLKDFPRPTEDTMVSRLKQSAWTSQNGGLGTNLSSKFTPRSDTGKTGLVNLGNTCYMNSVIQALFMTHRFSEDILAYPLYNRQSIMNSLQLTFAFLAHTQRAAYAPKDFLRMSRPPWFAPGSQQDCSEFLKYLLDRLDEEEKGWRQMVSKAAESLSTSLSSPTSPSTSSLPPSSTMSTSTSSTLSTVSSAEPTTTSSSSSQDEECFLKDAEEMETETSTTANTTLPSSSKSASTTGPLATFTETNKPVSHPTDEDTSSFPTTPNTSFLKISNIASCRKNVGIESLDQFYANSMGDSFPQKPESGMKKGGVSEELKESIVESFFGGKSATHIQCLNCGTVSSRTETFFDLPLGFPGTEGRDNLLGGHCDAPSEERRSEATVDLPQENRSVVGASALVASVSAEHQASTSSIGDSMPMPSISGPVVMSNATASRTHLEDLLKHYLSPEMLVKDNRYHCDKCQSLQDAEKSLEIIKAPRVLIITLLRFSYDVKLQRRCKIMEDVHYPQVLHLDVNSSGQGECSADGSHRGPCTKRTRQNSAGVAHCSTKKDDCNARSTVKYILSAVVVHSGMSSESGHYYCYACDDVDEHIRQAYLQEHWDKKDGAGIDNNKGAQAEEDLPRKWYLFNDSRVTASKFDSFGNVTQRFPRDTAYVLFYRMCEGVRDGGENAAFSAALKSASSSLSSASSSSMSSLSLSLKEKHLRKDLQEAIHKDNSLYIQEQEFEARAAAQKKKRPVSAAPKFFQRNFDDKDEPPGGCGLGGGGSGSGLGFTSSRLIF